jgi:hypothetical protein
MVFPLLISALAGGIALAAGLYMTVPSGKGMGKWLALAGALLLCGSLGLLAFSLFVFASGM